MNKVEFEELLRADRHRFYISGVASRTYNSGPKKKKHRKRSLVLEFVAGLAAVVLLGAGYAVYSHEHILHSTNPSQTSASHINQANSLPLSTINKMADYALSFHYTFMPYIPTGGLGATDYTVLSMSSEPSFTLFSVKRNEFIRISEYASSNVPEIQAYSWVKKIDPRNGMAYWQHQLYPDIIKFYFAHKSTIVMLEINTGHQYSTQFPSNLNKSLTPLYKFSKSN